MLMSAFTCVLPHRVNMPVGLQFPDVCVVFIIQSVGEMQKKMFEQLVHPAV